MKITKCPKCQSNLLYINYDGDTECYCGYIIYANTYNEVQSQINSPSTTEFVLKTGKHYKKALDLTPRIVLAIQRGLGVRQVAREFGIAVNTTRNIIRENNKASAAQKTRREREKEHHWLKFTLKGLIVHKDRYPRQIINEHAAFLLSKYLKGNRTRTINELIAEGMNKNDLSVGNLTKYTIIMLDRELAK